MKKAQQFLSENWFKIAVAVLLIFIAFKKDLNFRFNLNGPVRQVAPEKQLEPEQSSNTERLTMKADPKNASAPLSVDHLTLEPFTKEQNTLPPALQEMGQIAAAEREAFINRFKKVALDEQAKFGIPASVIMGNALLISRIGHSEAVIKGNNFFGLICTPDWQGDSGTYGGKCYRHYDTAWMSFRDHSLYLTTGKFTPLRNLKGKPYPDWAAEMEKTGFAPEPGFARTLIQVIEAYQLNQLDK